jgi:Zinc dependent phospholipase C
VTRPLACAAALFCLCPALSSYSVLTHEAIIDTVWDQKLKPLLLARFPNASADELHQAHAYAYGGCIIQDMGYYPFGSQFFSHLVHYVRSGDFIVNMLRESQNLNEYAFALGALAHYASDNEGHSIAVNPSVSMQFPKLQRRFGKSVTFADNPTAHMKVEFGFDVLQVTRGMYAPQSYHDFIGFQVSKDLLQRAFRETYSLDLKDVFTDLDLSIGTYRHTVSGLFPAMSKIAWSMKKKDLMKAQPTLNRTEFVYNLSTAAYHKEWNSGYEKPRLGARILGFVIRMLPKVGPLKALQFKIPTAQTEKLFEASVDKTLDFYRTLLTEQERKQLALENLDFDTGRRTAPGEYKLADNTYANLAVKLAERDPANVDPAVRKDVLAFFRTLDAPHATKRDTSLWVKTVAAVGKLKREPVASGGQ